MAETQLETARDERLGLRPLTARSVIVSMLLGTQPPTLPTRVLVAATGLFGVSESATRTALSRLVANGQLEADGSSYRLIGELLGRQERQETGRSAVRQNWSGEWAMVVLDPAGRPAAERARHRIELDRARLAELREGVWVRPDNLGRLDLDVVAAEVPGASIGRWRSVDGESAPGWGVDRLWDLDGWTAQASGLGLEITRLTPGLEAGDEALLARGFVVAAAMLRLFQRDPLLPDGLLPPDWPGASIRSDYDRFDLAYRSLLRAFFRRQRA